MRYRIILHQPLEEAMCGTTKEKKLRSTSLKLRYYLRVRVRSRDQKSNQSGLGFVQQIQKRADFVQHRLRFLNMVITPTLSYASGTWTLSKEHERMIRSTQRKMLRLIVQTKRKYKNKPQPSRNEEDEEDEKQITEAQMKKVQRATVQTQIAATKTVTSPS